MPPIGLPRNLTIRSVAYDAGLSNGVFKRELTMKNQVMLENLETEVAPCGLADPTAAIIIVIIYLL